MMPIANEFASTPATWIGDDEIAGKYTVGYTRLEATLFWAIYHQSTSGIRPFLSPRRIAHLGTKPSSSSYICYWVRDHATHSLISEQPNQHKQDVG